MIENLTKPKIYPKDLDFNFEQLFYLSDSLPTHWQILLSDVDFWKTTIFGNEVETSSKLSNGKITDSAIDDVMSFLWKPSIAEMKLFVNAMDENRKNILTDTVLRLVPLWKNQIKQTMN